MAASKKVVRDYHELLAAMDRVQQENGKLSRCVSQLQHESQQLLDKVSVLQQAADVGASEAVQCPLRPEGSNVHSVGRTAEKACGESVCGLPLCARTLFEVM